MPQTRQQEKRARESELIPHLSIDVWPVVLSFATLGELTSTYLLISKEIQEQVIAHMSVPDHFNPFLIEMFKRCDSRWQIFVYDNKSKRFQNETMFARLVTLYLRLFSEYKYDYPFNSTPLLTWAARHNFPELATFLLQDERCDPSAEDDITIAMACYFGWEPAFVQELMKDERVDLSNRNNAALYDAVKGNNLTLALVLLEDERVYANTKILNTALKSQDDVLIDTIRSRYKEDVQVDSDDEESDYESTDEEEEEEVEEDSE
jgi:hypothetical protein